MRYSVTGADVALVSVSGSSFTYQTNLLEPRTLSFSLCVHAQGDTINSAVHKLEFPSTIKI